MQITKLPFEDAQVLIQAIWYSAFDIHPPATRNGGFDARNCPTIYC